MKVWGFFDEGNDMYEYKAKITRVVDGDTFDAIVDLGFNVTFAIRIRLRLYDTPETWRPRNDLEEAHGNQATEFVKNVIEGKDVRIVTYKDGASIYGRYEADVYYHDLSGIERNLGSMLDQHGLLKKDSYQ